jgi:hypothetical protein
MGFARTGDYKAGYNCKATRCKDKADVSLSIQISTPGGRKGRVQVRTQSVRLCNSHLDGLAKNIPVDVLGVALEKAIKEVRSQQ